ncbi:MAG: hypothetical protein WA973_18865 [Mesorhizobium sp.]
MTQPSSVQRLFPFAPGGAAADLPLPSGRVTLSDLTERPRFGIKGPGSAGWLASQGLDLPAVNRTGMHEGMRVLRLGNEDILFLAEDAASAFGQLVDRWNRAEGARGYSSWREEGWAWMRLSGPDAVALMARLCAVDLRPEHFGPDRIAQTRVASIEAVVARGEEDFDILFDISLAAFFARAVGMAEAIRQTTPEAGDIRPSTGPSR